MNVPDTVLNTFHIATRLVPQAYEVGTLAKPHFIDETPEAQKGTVIVQGFCTSEPKSSKREKKSISFGGADNGFSLR